MNITVNSLYSYSQFALLQFLAFCFVFSVGLQKRKQFILRMILCFLVCYGLNLLVMQIKTPWGLFSLSVKFVLVFLLGCLTLFSCFKMKPISALFLGTTAYTVRHIIYLFRSFIAIAFTDRFVSDRLMYYVFYFTDCIFALLVFLPLILLVRKIIRDNPNVVLPPWHILLISLFGLSANVVFNGYNLRDFKALEISTRYMMLLFNALFSGSVLIIMFGMVHTQKMHDEIQIINQVRHEEEKQYEISKENINLINIKCHDLRHQIRHLTDEKESVSKEELNTIQNAIRIYDTRVKTGNPSLDVILQEKSLICQKENIVFNCLIDGAALSFMKDSDIYSLFGNIIDNAIASVRKITDSDSRIILIKIKKELGGVFCYQENPYFGNIEMKEGIPQSPNRNTGFHGFGMLSIQQIIRSYGGNMVINTANSRFTIKIFFPKDTIAEEKRR